MKIFGFALIAVLALTGCMTVNVPVNTVSDPARPLSKATRIALYRESDMRIQKRLFAERIERYLTEAGFNVVAPDDAEVLVAIHIATERIMILQADSGFYPRPSSRLDTRIKEGESRFSFLAYESDSLWSREPKTVWEGSVVVAQETMQKNEQPLVLELFSHFGESFTGKTSATIAARSGASL